MCFERLLQAFARWQPDTLFDTGAQPILECRWTDSYSQPSLQTQFKVATVYSIHTQSLSWCSTGLVPNVLPRRDEGSGEPCAVDRALWNIGTHSRFEPGTSGSRVQSSNHYTTAAHVARPLSEQKLKSPSAEFSLFSVFFARNMLEGLFWCWYLCFFWVKEFENVWINVVELFHDLENEGHGVAPHSHSHTQGQWPWVSRSRDRDKKINYQHWIPWPRKHTHE